MAARNKIVRNKRRHFMAVPFLGVVANGGGCRRGQFRSPNSPQRGKVVTWKGADRNAQNYNPLTKLVKQFQNPDT